MKSQITEILSRNKYSYYDSFVGEMRYSDEEYAEMIYREVVKALEERIVERLQNTGFPWSTMAEGEAFWKARSEAISIIKEEIK